MPPNFSKFEKFLVASPQMLHFLWGTRKLMFQEEVMWSGRNPFSDTPPRSHRISHFAFACIKLVSGIKLTDRPCIKPTPVGVLGQAHRGRHVPLPHISL
jgi:hypothetical protein